MENLHKSKFVKVPLALIIPETKIPCSVFLVYKGKYLEVIKKDNQVPLSLLAKMKLEGNHFGYVLEHEGTLWESWVDQRYSVSVPRETYSPDWPKKAQIELAKFFNLAQEKIRPKEEDIISQTQYKEALEELRSFSTHPSLRWYFGSAPKKENLEHAARVSFMVVLFSSSLEDLMEEEQKEPLIIGSILHELVGDPSKASLGKVSQETLKYIKQKELVIPPNVLQFLTNCDVLIDPSFQPTEKNLPQQISEKIFSVVNTYEHFRMKMEGGTRRTQMDRAIAEIKKWEKYFDEIILIYFLKYLEKIEIFS